MRGLRAAPIVMLDWGCTRLAGVLAGQAQHAYRRQPVRAPDSARCLRRQTCWQQPSPAARPIAGRGPCRAARAARSASAWSRAPTAPGAPPKLPRRAWVHAGASPKLDLVQRGMAAAPSRSHAAVARPHHARSAASAGAARGARGPVSGAPGLMHRQCFTWAVALTPWKSTLTPARAGAPSAGR